MESLTKITKNDAANAWTDEFGVIYSADKKRLLWVPAEICKYSVPEGTEVICDWAFRDCELLESVELCKSLLAIGFHAFHDCTSLKSIIIPGNITKIESGSFWGCESLQSVTILEGVKIIGEEAFAACISIESLGLPNSLTTIGEGAFGSCESLKSVLIPTSVTSIGREAFSCCDCEIISKSECFLSDGSGLYSVKEKKLIYCSKSIVKYSISDSTNIIGGNAFFSCENLKSIVIPDSVTRIEDGAFMACYSLREVQLSKSLKEIGEYAFSSCRSIKSIILPESLISIEKGAFAGCDSLDVLYVPKGSSSRFEELIPDFNGKIIEMDDQDSINCDNNDYDDEETMLYLIPDVLYKKSKLEEQWRDNHWYYTYPSVRDYVKSLAYGDDVNNFLSWLFSDARFNYATAWSLPLEYDIALKQFFNLFFDLD